MIGKLSNSRIKPQALGVTSNSSTYGQTIPVIYGRTAGALYLIWCANVRPGPSAKKGKSGGSKKGKGTVTTYVANADALVGTNPIAHILECWDNNNAKLGLNFVEYSAPAASSVTIPDSLFYCLLGVTVTVDYDVTFDDYGGPGPQTYSGSFDFRSGTAPIPGPIQGRISIRCPTSTIGGRRAVRPSRSNTWICRAAS